MTLQNQESASLRPPRSAYQTYNTRLGRYLNSAEVQSNMQGEIYSCARGKELMVGIGCVSDLPPCRDKMV